MRRFDRDEEGGENRPPSERLQAFTKMLWDALVPKDGECVSVQGELIRGKGRLQHEYANGAMFNYYWSDDGDTLPETYFGKLLFFVLDTMIANRNNSLVDQDVAYFSRVRGLLETDWVRRRRIEQLKEKEDASDSEGEELDQLEEEDGERRVWWEELFDRAERCIANWCIANPQLIDRRGRPVEEGGVRDLTDVLRRPGAGGTPS